MMSRPFAIAFGFLIAMGGMAHARDAVVSTRVCEPLPQQAALEISPADDTALYLAVKKKIREAVTAAGHPVEKSGNIELYYTVTESPVRIKEGGASLGRLEVGTIQSRQHALLLLNVWSLNQDSVLGGRKTKAKEGITNYLLMAIELTRRDNGRCIWRGEGAAELSGMDPKDLAVRLAESILEFLGRPVTKEPVVLD